MLWPHFVKVYPENECHVERFAPNWAQMKTSHGQLGDLNFRFGKKGLPPPHPHTKGTTLSFGIELNGWPRRLCTCIPASSCFEVLLDRLLTPNTFCNVLHKPSCHQYSCCFSWKNITRKTHKTFTWKYGFCSSAYTSISWLLPRHNNNQWQFLSEL